MIGCRREPTPPILDTNGAAWTTAYMAGLGATPPRKFVWPTYEGQPLNQLLLGPLRKMTAEHCAYCDGFPLRPFARETIDHFRPKGRNQYPDLAFDWPNLFVACDVCQAAKGKAFDPLWLKPDDIGYSFERYFLFNFRTGEIEVNPAASPGDQARAEKTIADFGLNDRDRPSARKRELRSQSQLPHVERPYRYMLT